MTTIRINDKWMDVESLESRVNSDVMDEEWRGAESNCSLAEFLHELIKSVRSTDRPGMVRILID